MDKNRKSFKFLNMELKFLTKDSLQNGTEKLFIGKYRLYVCIISGILLAAVSIFLRIHYALKPMEALDVCLILWVSLGCGILCGFIFSIPISLVITYTKKKQYQYLDSLTLYNGGLKEALLFLTADGWITLMKEHPESYGEYLKQNLPAYSEAVTKKFSLFCYLSDPLDKKDEYGFNDFFKKLKEYRNARNEIHCPEPNFEIYIQSLAGQEIGIEKWDSLWKVAALRNDIAVMLSDFRKMLAKRNTLSEEIEFYRQKNERVSMAW